MKAKKNYLLTFVSGFGGAAVSTAIGLVAAPLSLSYWGEERYGLWAILLSVLSYLNVSNFGIGQAATTLIGKNNDFGDKRSIAKRAAMSLAVAMTVCIAILLMMNSAFPSWHRSLGKIPGELEGDAKTTSLFIILFFFVNLPFTLVSSILLGTQRAYVENVFQILGTVSNFLSLLLVIALRLPLPWMAIMNGSIIFLLNGVKTAVALTGKGGALLKQRDSRGDPTRRPSEDATYGILIRTSLRFFLIWLAATLVWNTDNFVVSNVIGLKEVTPYSITFKFYNLIFTCIFIVNNSLLPLMAKEFGAGNWEWITRNFKRFSVLGSSLGGLALVGGLCFGRDFIYAWTGARGYAGVGVLACLGVYSYLLSMVNFNSGIINTFNYTKGTWLIAFAEGGIKIGSSILLGKAFGLVGVAAGTMLGSLLAPAWICPLVIRRRSGSRLAFPWSRTVAHLGFGILPLGAFAMLVQSKIDDSWVRILTGSGIVILYCAITVLTWPSDFRGELHGLWKKIKGASTKVSMAGTDTPGTGA